MQSGEQRTKKREAARFYNRPEAAADYDHWLRLDFWTTDEAVALLLGKNPEVLTPQRVQKELNPEWRLLLDSKPQPTEFLRQYEALRKIAQRADAMRGAEIRPAVAIEWGITRAKLQLPEALIAYLEAVKGPPAQPRAQAAPADLGSPAAPPARHLRRKALVRELAGRWPTIEADMTHASRNGLSEARGDDYGMWDEEKALQWARSQGKLTGVRKEAAALVTVWPPRGT